MNNRKMSKKLAKSIRLNLIAVGRELTTHNSRYKFKNLRSIKKTK